MENKDSFDIAELKAQIGRLPERRVPEGLTDRIMERVMTPRPGVFARLTALVTRPWVISFRPAYALSLVFLVGVSFMLGRGFREAALPEPGNQPLVAALQEVQFDNAQAAYLLGRSLLAADRQNLALPLLQRAALLEPENPEFAYWEGLGHWANGDRGQERTSYMRGLTADPESVPLLVNLGHSYLNERNYERALEAYRAALTLSPGEPVARYNTGLIYRKLDRVDEEIAAWKAYLQENRTGRWAFRAVERLNERGDFSYRSYQIGARKLILAPGILVDDTLPESRRRAELSPLISLLEQDQRLRLEVIVFFSHDASTARRRAQEIKQLLVDSTDRDVAARIALSWFDGPENITVPTKGEFEFAEGVLLFGSRQDNEREEISI